MAVKQTIIADYAHLRVEKKEKLYVIDTSVILYDHSAIRNFGDHEVVIPIQVLEELDKFKNGNETRNLEARTFIRFIDKIAKDNLINDWVPFSGSGSGKFKVVMHSAKSKLDAETIFGDNKYDHKILNTALTLQQENKSKKVILVSKDICLRLKAKSLNLHAEDYDTGKIKDLENLSVGKTIITTKDTKLFTTLEKKGSIPASMTGLPKIKANHFFIFKNGRKTVLGKYDQASMKINKIEKQEVYSIRARNDEQSFAINALMDPKIKLLTIQGMAGTGKTLLALACALEQRRNYHQIYITSPTIPLSNKDMGYLPGSLKSKIDPYMQPLWDNLKFIKGQFAKKSKELHRIDEMLESEKIAIAPLAYIRGRSLSKVFFIVDEAQNLTPHEVKTIISRAGDETKIIFMGDIYQIDTPYLDSQSNGLSYLIESIKSNPLFAHITLEKGERSDLANLANALL